MPNIKTIYNDVISRNRDNNIRFSDMQRLLDYFGFDLRVKGDHFIYTRSDVREIINVQPNGNKAKAYQIKQLREIIKEYDLEV